MVSHKELEPQPSGWGSFFCFFAYSEGPVFVFLRLNSHPKIAFRHRQRIRNTWFALRGSRHILAFFVSCSFCFATLWITFLPLRLFSVRTTDKVKG